MHTANSLRPKRILIIGGGIAGLSAAYYAVQKSKKQAIPVQVTLIEADHRWGGKIVTRRVALANGQFIIEGGPDTFLATKPWGVALCKELGLEQRLHGTNPHQKNTYVLRRERLQPLPDGLAMMIPTNVQAILKSQLISWPGKARMGLDFLLPPHPLNGDESLGEFVSRRLGREAYENLIEPLMSGIYAGDGDALSLASTFPYLRDLELKYGSLARGALQMRKQSQGKALQGSRSAFLTPTTGLAEMIEALVQVLSENGVTLRLRTQARRIHSTALVGDPITDGWAGTGRRPTSTDGRREPAVNLRSAATQWRSLEGDDNDHYAQPAGSPAPYRVELHSGETLPADLIILATPAYASAALLDDLDPRLAATLREIPYASTATISLAYLSADLPRPLDGYGYVIPRREGRRALACTWTSTKFPHRAPAGDALLRVFVGRAGQEQALPRDEAALVELAREEVRLTLGIAAAPLLSRAFVWPDSMPQYNLGHPARLEQIARRLDEHPGLALAGSAYRGIGIPDCIHSAESAVDLLLDRVFEPAVV